MQRHPCQEERSPRPPSFQSQISVGIGVDMRPAAQVDCGIMIDHATGIVIGVTVAGVPAQIVGPTRDENPAFGMDHGLK